MFLSYLIFLSILTSFLSLMIIYLNKLNGYKYSDNQDGVQKFHSSPTPRLGGVAIFIVFLFSIFFLFEFKGIYFLILLSSLPTFFLGLLEDLFRNINPRKRLLAAFFSGILFVVLSGYSVKNVNIPFFDNILSIYFISLFFTSFAIAGIANSINIIDGFHGLASGSLIIMFSAFALIGYFIEDYLIFNLSIVSISIFFGFFIINFPSGLIFLGDAGAYLGGFLLSVIAVLLPSRNPEISSWVCFLICLYPITETIFSIYRKSKRKGHHPSKPDSVHLHMLIYRNLSRELSKNINAVKFRNAITSIIIWILPLTSCVAAVLAYKNLSLLFIIIILFLIFYIVVYRKVSLNW